MNHQSSVYQDDSGILIGQGIELMYCFILRTRLMTPSTREVLLKRRPCCSMTHSQPDLRTPCGHGA